MKQPLQLIPVQALYTKPTGCFVSGITYSGYAVLDQPAYPEAPWGDKLRRARDAVACSLGDAGRLFGVTPADISGLERGRLTLSREQWLEMLCEIRLWGKAQSDFPRSQGD